MKSRDQRHNTILEPFRRANFRNGRGAFTLIVKRHWQHCSICRPGNEEEEEEERRGESTKKFLKVARLDNENRLGEEKARHGQEKQHKRLLGANKVCDVDRSERGKQTSDILNKSKSLLQFYIYISYFMCAF